MASRGTHVSLGVLISLSACWARDNPNYSVAANDTGSNPTTSSAEATGTPPATSDTPPVATTANDGTTAKSTAEGPGEDSSDEGVPPLDTGEPPTAECPADQTCETVPDGWLPVMIPPKDNDVCPPGSQPFQVLTTEPEYDCDCDCAEPFNGCQLEWQLNNPGCNPVLLDNTGCGLTSGSLIDGNYYAQLIPPPCTAESFLVPVTPAREQLVCELNEMASMCGEGHWCAPEQAACLLAEGRQECPADFEDRDVLAGSWTAPACVWECGGCNFECAEEVTMYPGGSCDGMASAVLAPAGVCSMTPPGIVYYAIGYDQEPTCVTPGVIPAPPTTTDSEYTLCCRG